MINICSNPVITRGNCIKTDVIRMRKGSIYKKLKNPPSLRCIGLREKKLHAEFAEPLRKNSTQRK